MATWYVDSAATGLNDGTSKTNAWTTLGAAFTGVTVAGDVIWVSHQHSETISTNTTYAVAAAHTQSNPLVIQCRNFTTDALATGGVINLGAAGILLAIGNGLNNGHLIHGIKIVGSGNYAYAVRLAYGNACLSEYSECEIDLSAVTSAAATVYVGGQNASYVPIFITRNLQIKWGATTQYIALHSNWMSYGDNLSAGTVHSATLFKPSGTGSCEVDLYGPNLSGVTNICNMDAASDSAVFLRLYNPALKAGFVLLTTPVANTSHQGFVEVFDGRDGDNHYFYGYANSLGTLLCDTGVYVNDNICDTNLSWKITTTANAHHYNPFITPTISIRHIGVSAITPYLECLRSGSTTAYDDQHLWSRWSYKGTSGSTQSTIVEDRCALDGTPTAQASSSKTAADWTGEDATNNWFGKLGPSSSITPVEVGDIMVQIALGEPSATVYVDPQIRGL